MSSDADGFYKAYEDYSKTLRTWLVAYGIGGPVLFLTNENISEVIAGSGQARLIAGLFLSGVAFQVALAAINKTAMWVCYVSDSDEEAEKKWWCKSAHWLSWQYWIDLLMDAASLAAFSIATWLTFNILIS